MKFKDSICFAGRLTYLPKNASLPITLKSREFEVFTVVPLRHLPNGVSFAPIGLVKMFNSGGAITEIAYESTRNSVIYLRVRGCGEFGFYASASPSKITTVGSDRVEFAYEKDRCLVTFCIDTPQEDSYMWNIIVEF